MQACIQTAKNVIAINRTHSEMREEAIAEEMSRAKPVQT